MQGSWDGGQGCRHKPDRHQPQASCSLQSHKAHFVPVLVLCGRSPMSIIWCIVGWMDGQTDGRLSPPGEDEELETEQTCYFPPSAPSTSTNVMPEPWARKKRDLSQALHLPPLHFISPTGSGSPRG